MLVKEDKNKQRIDMVVVLVFCYTEFVGGDIHYDAVDELDKTDW